MSSWGTAIFSDDLTLDIRREYNVLLSVGKSSEEAEKMLIDYYFSFFNNNDPDEDLFWFALALSEWEKGRLSLAVKEKALCALEFGRDIERWNTSGNEKNYEKRKKVLMELKEVITSPMLPAKKIKKPMVHHCPWRIGSLLAYRLVSNKEYLQDSSCNMKYVLLRVVRIDKQPISKTFDTEFYNESMMVGLYNWIGSEIPDSEIVHNLKYIPIVGNQALKPKGDIDFSLLNAFDEDNVKDAKAVLQSFFNKKTEKCVWLDWRSSKNCQGDITLLDVDEFFQSNIPEFFAPMPTSHTYTHLFAFDIALSKIFAPYLDRQDNTDSVSI